MKKYCLIILAAILSFSCKSKDCAKLNSELIHNFEKEIRIIKKLHDGHEVLTVEYRNALLYLSNTTQIMTLAEYGDIPKYHNDRDYQHDIKAWENWLKENRCLRENNN